MKRKKNKLIGGIKKNKYNGLRDYTGNCKVVCRRR